jgi:hypothetical protein
MIYKILNLLDCKIPFNHVSALCDQTRKADETSTQLNKMHQFPLALYTRKNVEVYQEKYSCPSVISLSSICVRL